MQKSDYVQKSDYSEKATVKATASQPHTSALQSGFPPSLSPSLQETASIASVASVDPLISQPTDLEAQAISFFQRSAGNWQSHRRYYTLANSETQEVVSDITIQFLAADHGELVELGERHALSVPMRFGAKVTWHSHYIAPSRKPSVGTTVFGIRGDVMYRDRGFATPKPVTAQYKFTDARTLVLRTEYNGSAFEEELKLIGDNYRTRQTIISRAGEELMIGQYLEKRV